MRRNRSIVITAFIAVAALAGCSSSGDPVASPSSTSASAATAYQAALEQQIPELMKANAIPGVGVLIRSREQGDWQATFGTAELDAEVPVTMDDTFRIGSNTKTMTSTVILQLAQEGKLALDDPISKYVDGVPNGEEITIAQLSEMRSGLVSYTFDKKFNETLDKDPQKAWTPQELLDIGLSKKPTAQPGTEYDYSNTNIVLLGVVVEKLTGMSATQAFEERIFKPLGLSRTSLPVNTESALPDPHPQGYQFGTNVQTIESYAVPKADLPAALDGSLAPLNYTDSNPSWAWTAGGAISTAEDLATYAEALVDGGLLDAEMQQTRMDSLQPIAPGAPVSYGLGIAQFAPDLYGHDGQLPGFSSFMARDAKAGNTIIIFANLSASPVDGENAAVVLGKAVIGALYGSSAVPGGDPAGASAGATPSG